MMVRKTKRFIIISHLIIFMGILSACQTMIHSSSGTTTTVIMVRHAERTSFGGKLTSLGRKNAQALANAIGDMKIDAIYSPDLERNLKTVEPLAEHLGIKVSKVEGDPDTHDVAITLIGKHAGKTVLWVGNTTNLPDIYYSLGGEGESPVKYGDLFILTVPDKGTTKVVKKTWGQRK